MEGNEDNNNLKWSSIPLAIKHYLWKALDTKY